MVVICRVGWVGRNGVNYFISLPKPVLWTMQIFERDHETPPHTHETAHELFFILSGSGTAFCDGQRFSIAAGDVVVFPPTSGDTTPDCGTA